MIGNVMVQRGVVEPTDAQILEAAEKAGLWPNTAYMWLPAFHRYHEALRTALSAKFVACPSEKYPTVWAYERACKALDAAKERIAELERDRETLTSSVAAGMYKITSLERQLAAK